MQQFIAIKHDLTHESSPSTLKSYVAAINDWLKLFQNEKSKIINISVAMTALDKNVTRYSTTVVYNAEVPIVYT